MKVTPIYDCTLKDLESGVRRVNHQGGQWSGKTVGILGALATLANQEDGERAGITTVTSMSFPHLKGGALRDFEMYVYPYFKSAIKQYHKTNHIFTFNSGSQIEFKSFENEMTARGAKRKRLFINEANSFSEMLEFQLDSRSDQTVYDYNPSARFWVHEKRIGFPGTNTYISDHRHNPFIKPEKHLEIESNPDKELWKVYARGLTGNITGVIFPHWKMIDESDFPEDDDYIFGIDFGYTNDPTAIVKLCKVGNVIFVKEIAYETGLAPVSVYQILHANGWKDWMPLYCEHDPDMIKALRLHGIKSATPARKGQGSINAGIELLKTYDVRYTNNSRNLHRDRGQYVWETDKDTGKLTNMPIARYDHLFDAIRYGVYTKYLRHELKRA